MADGKIPIEKTPIEKTPIEKTPIEKTPIHVRYEYNEVIKLIKKEEGLKSADYVIGMLLMKQRPDLVKLVKDIEKLKKGDN